MMFIYAIIFGIIQGVTEFFPVSSSGHLLIAHKLFPVFTKGLDLTFDVALHLSTLFILLLFYGKDLVGYVRAFSKKGDAVHRRMGIFIILATLPAALVGYFFEHRIAESTRDLSLTAIMLLLGAVLFFLVEWFGVRRFSLQNVRWWQVLLIGCAQAFALIPGVSRSGITIIAGMALGLKRETATHFSFLLAIPIIALAGGDRLVSLIMSDGLSQNATFIFITGFVTAAVVGAFCIRYLLEHVKTKTFIPFAVYRVVLGVTLLLVVFLQK